MAKITCAISGITFTTSHLPIVIKPEDGYFHPIFALPYKKLYGLYSKHCSQELTPTDSYLLLLAFLHSTEKVVWRCPASCNPKDRSTLQLISEALPALIRVIEISNSITTPAFKQPSFVVSTKNKTDLLTQLPEWIATWEANISDFRDGYKQQKLEESIQKIENKLTYYIKAGLTPERYAHVVADWADKVSGFPPQKAEAWKKIIRSCFNETKMFSTPLKEIKEIKEHCEQNIAAGSIHFHTLIYTLKKGYLNHLGYLGMTDPESNGTYSLVPLDSTPEQVEISAILAKATECPPKRTDFASEFEFTRAKLRYIVAQRLVHKNENEGEGGDNE